MATNVSQVWGSAGNFTITMASLANAAVRQSTSLDLTNTGTFPNILDLEIQVLAEVGSSPGGSLALYIWVYGSSDGSTYPDTITGIDGAYTGNLTNLTSLRQLNISSSGVQFGSNPISLAAAFGGTLPAKVGMVVQNNTGVALDSNSAHNQIIYRPLYTITQ
jgi:hypothetical protein